MTDQEQPDSVTPDPVCFIENCKERVTNIFWGKTLCAYHYEISRH